jgi:uncharacterized protein
MANALDAGFRRELDAEVARHIKGIERRIAEEAAANGIGLRDVGELPRAAGGDPFASCLDRRAFMRGGAALIGGAAIAGALQVFSARRAEAQGFRDLFHCARCPYGDPLPTLDEVTGLPLIGLPPGFRYWSHGWTGDPIVSSEANVATPPLHDGMGVLRQIGSFAILCRNHEAGVPGGSFIGGGLEYSPAAPGGNTNLVFDTRARQWFGAWPTLSGTSRNCAGGITPHATWLSCEESLVESRSGDQTFSHGWVFEVPAFGVSNGEPIRAMGRRNHEAAAVDPRTGIVYLTEDEGPGGVYRFIPGQRQDYAAGGILEMLKIVGMPQVNLRGLNPVGGGGAAYPAPIGVPLGVEWVPIADPENLNGASNFAQGFALGGADFRRPEGAWYGGGHIYFVSTDGGQGGNGMVFSLDTRQQTLTLIYDAPTENELDNPDNLVVTPRGGLLFCEDNSGSPSYLLNGVNTERLVGLTREGEIFTFATNLMDFTATGMGPYRRDNNAVVFNQNYRANEWAGATFDASGQWLFVNIQTPGVTFAITGPWWRGPL